MNEPTKPVIPPTQATADNLTPEVYKGTFGQFADGTKVQANDPLVIEEQKRFKDTSGVINPDVAMGNLVQKNGIVQSSETIRRQEDKTKADAANMMQRDQAGNLPGYTKDSDGFYVDPKTGAKFWESSPGVYMSGRSAYDPKDGSYYMMRDGVRVAVDANGVDIPQGSKPTTTPTDGSQFMTDGLSDLKKMRDSLGILSEEEKSQIEAQAQATGEEFNVLIRQAEEEKRQGMAKSLVGAGERGGFMNTQFAGVSAVSPTEGGSFVGAGGYLETVKSAYDRNIDDLKSKRVSAMQAARVAAETAIRTGKKDDYNIAQNYLQTAKDIFVTQNQLAREKVDAISKAKQAEVDYKKSNLDWLKESLGSGVALDDAKKKEFDTTLGVPGFTDAYSATLKKAQTIKTAQDQMGVAKDLIDLLSKVPAGTKVPITNADGSITQYEGMKSVDPNVQIYKETDRKTGKEVIIEYNKDTQKVTVIPTGVTAKAVGGGSTAHTGTYFTRPDPKTGDIQYLFGDAKNPNAAQMLDKKQYLEGVSKAQGVLDPKENNKDNEFITKDWIKNNFDLDGWFTNPDAEADKILKSVTTYREAGYSDKDIFKMLQEE